MAALLLLIGVALVTLSWLGERTRAEMRSETMNPRPQIYAAPQPTTESTSAIATVSTVVHDW